MKKFTKPLMRLLRLQLNMMLGSLWKTLKTISMGAHQRRPKGARRGGFRRMLTRAQYMKLKHYVDYRLLVEGFPPIRRGKPTFIEVHPAYTSSHVRRVVIATRKVGSHSRVRLHELRRKRQCRPECRSNDCGQRHSLRHCCEGKEQRIEAKGS